MELLLNRKARHMTDKAVPRSNLLNQLIEATRDEGITMHELSRRSNVTYDTIRRAFIGECDTVTSKFEKLAAAVDMVPCLVPYKATLDEQATDRLSEIPG